MKAVRITVAVMFLGLLFGANSQSGSGELLPEILRCKPVDQEELVDLYTGDFSYSIPLISIPSKNASFPITLGYAAGVKSNEEASCVGLGWSINPGHIMRSVRAIPDDFEGTDYRYIIDMPDEWTYGARVGSFAYNGSYNCGTKSFSHEGSLNLTSSDQIQTGLTVGRTQSGDIYGSVGVGMKAGPKSSEVGRVGVGFGEDRGLAASFSVAGTGASLSSKKGLAVGGTAVGLASDPGQFIRLFV